MMRFTPLLFAETSKLTDSNYLFMLLLVNTRYAPLKETGGATARIPSADNPSFQCYFLLNLALP